MRDRHTYGTNPIEEAIMSLWDDGLSNNAIAAELGLNPRRVETVVQNLSEGRSDLWHLSVPRQTDRLLAAIARAHPERVVTC